MNLEDLNELDFSNVGIWPTPVKMVAVVLVAIAVMVAGYYLVIEAQLTQLDSVERKELDLRKEFETKQAKASNLDAYRQQLEEMKQSFGTMLRQLPDKTEVAELLVDVSQTGLASGLEFELFKPQEELPKDFYAELPIQVIVKGEYHEFGNFISGLAALPRIVTIHDIKIKRGDPKASDPKLTLEATAKTYRYLDEEEGE
ncbi:MAG: type 4a pilus biogenesis protein PilO [Candidatus Thiodiazotropha sp. (ex. Lucinisca nassula)]|uniref:Type 4a pilus biogenesis protein PilO n=1 Tax=Candidatus Thiodiazotropha taylori TaxID=2792791 RepID=A0A9E4P697_9GAMM|nr:type 4a pilus biogenesis protein PilO [Candidatus Thiodiazotropha taylori]MBW9258944.1 type 4a pilus biogenesis protein PilO [Candidatus Thiodiazotropha sp. (ex. Lucinisca nassula)]MBW9260182.1 type 4a pilus biogenesis protein PilO [Candidatus Thiodiazotropha sp. (ex. Lucinisca nassula)]MBW9271226.1 type 4a pilus biogenesis protein PilO [Candidatus Thiodiazotropha sp. (ex. Lucinisca nassula)]MCG7907797.1 type 4a pilus biogenesis protein PilO [Candidatus Thiodiazotropha taylori]